MIIIIKTILMIILMITISIMIIITQINISNNNDNNHNCCLYKLYKGGAGSWWPSPRGSLRFSLPSPLRGAPTGGPRIPALLKVKKKAGRRRR